MKKCILIITITSIIIGLSNCSNAQENKGTKLSEAEKARQVDSITRRAIERMIVDELDNTIFISANQLYADYKQNEKSANEKYLNKTICVTSEIYEEYTAEPNDEKYAFALKTKYDERSILCTFKDFALKKSKVKGNKIKIKGSCSGYSQDENVVVLNNCFEFNESDNNWKYIKEINVLNPKDLTIIYLGNKHEDSTSTIEPIIMFSNNKYYNIPVYYNYALDSNQNINFDLTNLKNLGFGTENASIYESYCENKLVEKYILPNVDSGAVLYEIKKGKQINLTKSTGVGLKGVSDWDTYCAFGNKKTNGLIYTNNKEIGLNYERFIKIPPPTLENHWGDGDDEHTRKFVELVDVNNDNIPELIYDISDYEGNHYEVWSFKNNSWIKVFG